MTELLKDKLKTGLFVSWLLTVIFSFLGSAVFAVKVPAIGELFPFRILLPLTALLYVIFLIRNKVNLWKDAEKLEKACWLLAAVLLLYGAVSLFFAIDFTFTFRRLFNLCFDLCFFLLTLRLCQDKQFLRYTLLCAGAMVLVLCIAGVYETFAGGIFNEKYDHFLRFDFFHTLLQPPVVTYGNTNDYSSVLVFTLAAILLFWAQGYLGGKKRIWVLFALFPLCFFVAKVASARLVLLCLWLLLGAVFVFFLLVDRKRFLVPLAVLLLFFSVNFTNQYRYIMPVVTSRVQYVAMQVGAFFHNEDLSELPDFVPPVVTPSSPHLKDEFFETDPETSELILNESGSGGVRVRLLKHALDCFIESKGMGAGLGNTEQLAKMKFAETRNTIWSIHCFPARLVADYGIWVLIPLCYIAVILVSQAVRAIIDGAKKKSGQKCAMGVLYFVVLLAYPLLATVSSDAQDLISMWLYLALVCVFSMKTALKNEENVPAE